MTVSQTTDEETDPTIETQSDKNSQKAYDGMVVWSATVWNDPENSECTGPIPKPKAFRAMK